MPSRSPVGGSGSSASAAPGSPATRCSRARGAPRSAAGIASRRRTSRALDGVEVELSPGAGRARRAGRSSSRPRTPARSQGRPRAEFLAELVSLQRSIVVAGAHGKTTTSGDDRVRPRRARPRSGVPDRRRGAAARRQRARRRRLARRRGRRVRPHGRARFGREIAVVTNVELDHHATFASRGRGRGAVRALARARAAGRARLGARARRARARGPGRAQPAQRGRRARRARARRASSARTPSRCSRASAAPAGASSSSASAAASPSSTTTRTIRPRSPRRSPRRASGQPARVLVLFQPHLYSRTRHLAHEFGAALSDGRRRLRDRDLPRARGAGRRA